jgi:hypothetical protein
MKMPMVGLLLSTSVWSLAAMELEEIVVIDDQEQKVATSKIDPQQDLPSLFRKKVTCNNCIYDYFCNGITNPEKMLKKWENEYDNWAKQFLNADPDVLQAGKEDYIQRRAECWQKGCGCTLFMAKLACPCLVTMSLIIYGVIKLSE